MAAQMHTLVACSVVWRVAAAALGPAAAALAVSAVLGNACASVPQQASRPCPLAVPQVGGADLAGALDQRGPLAGALPHGAGPG